MVPAEKILETAIREEVDFIGLSGLITPSLEEMVHVASEMQRQKFELPLLVGGATTSEIHAAVKIAPAYSGPVVHVKDASKAAGVLSSLMQEKGSEYAAAIRDKYKKLLDDHNSRRSDKILLTLDEARKNGLYTDWKSIKIHPPEKPGLHLIEEFDLNVLRKYIDWTFFFFAWKLNGKYPAIFDDPVKGEEARKLFDDAEKYLDEIIRKKIIKANGVFGLFPAVSSGDDIRVFHEKGKSETKAVLRFLRNQEKKEKGISNLCLSDFIAPESAGVADYLGVFVVTAPISTEAAAEYRDDDYSTIMIRMLSDRIAEAAAEYLHEQVRKKYWGYAAGEDLTPEELLKTKYRGIRPAPGYPACPDHTEKRTIFDLLDAERLTGAGLTESYAMTPPAAVSGYIFSHPASVYFNVGKIGEDQLRDYASRKKMSVEETARWLAPNL
jgi:5-methyltetrahydrofolate--homocysteine methyltransferase